jgi:hypothetical protein
MSPDLIAEVTLYPTEAGGKTAPALPGFHCPCVVSRTPPWVGHAAKMLLDEPLHPGEKRRVGFAFSLRESVEVILDARQFFLWEGRIVGEASVVEGGQGVAPDEK